MRPEDTYVFLDSQTIAGIAILIEVNAKGERHGIEVMVPAPNCPEDRREDVIQQIVQRGAPAIRARIKQQFGTTKYRVLGTEQRTMSANDVIREHNSTFRKDA